MVSDAMKLALYRAENFDYVTFRGWLLVQPQALTKTALAYPPNRLYEGPGDLIYFILGYGKDGHVVLGFVEEPDSAVVHADPSELHDVTNDLRKEAGLV